MSQAILHNAVEARLRNWGRWCKSGPPRGHCGSVEWQWSSRWKEAYGWAEIGQKAGIPDRVDVADAERVQGVMAKLDKQPRTLLALKYVKDLHPMKIAAALGCREWELDDILHMAMRDVELLLTEQGK